MKFDFRKPRNYVEFVCKGGEKKSAKIHYVFNDGTTSVVEVDVPMGEFIDIQFTEEENSNRRERYWVKFHLSQFDGDDDDSNLHQGMWLADKNLTPDKLLDIEEQQKQLDCFLATLSEVQRRRIQYRLDDRKISFREIARLENVDEKAIRKTFDAIEKKYEEFFKK